MKSATLVQAQCFGLYPQSTNDKFKLRLRNTHVKTSRRLPRLNAVRAFEVAARLQSFKMAGEELGVTPGAVSRQIEALEDSLGIRLFDRLHRKVDLTASGRLFFGEVSPALQRIANAAEALWEGQESRVLRIKLPPTCAIRWLVPRLARFHALFPDISVQVTTSHEPVDFEREPIDAAIYWGEALPRGLAGQRLFGEQLAIVCSPKLLARHSCSQIAANSLPKHVLLHSFRRPDDWRFWFSAAGLPDVALDRFLLFENSSLTYQGAIDGLGVAIAQLAFVSDDLREGRLVIANDQIVDTTTAYFLTYPRERAHLARIRALTQWLGSV
jgi:LysR family glycine cleavage system transcriptional activator